MTSTDPLDTNQLTHAHIFQKQNSTRKCFMHILIIMYDASNLLPHPCAIHPFMNSFSCLPATCINCISLLQTQFNAHQAFFCCVFVLHKTPGTQRHRQQFAQGPGQARPLHSTVQKHIETSVFFAVFPLDVLRGNISVRGVKYRMHFFWHMPMTLKSEEVYVKHKELSNCN